MKTARQLNSRCETINRRGKLWLKQCLTVNWGHYRFELLMLDEKTVCKFFVTRSLVPTKNEVAHNRSLRELLKDWMGCRRSERMTIPNKRNKPSVGFKYRVCDSFFFYIFWMYVGIWHRYGKRKSRLDTYCFYDCLAKSLLLGPFKCSSTRMLLLWFNNDFYPFSYVLTGTECVEGTA